jgi:hypothetical protein
MQTEPKVGQLYSCMEQSIMHGGNPRLTLPDSEDKFTLVRFRLDKNPGRSSYHRPRPPKSSGSRLPGWRCFVARANRSIRHIELLLFA